VGESIFGDISLGEVSNTSNDVDRDTVRKRTYDVPISVYRNRIL